jgi:hypothetical protein
MAIKSPLSNLVEVLRELTAAADEYRSTLETNEAATRAVLIDPALRALGWDIGNTHMVEVERTLERARVDYALYNSNGQICVIIEAKSLGSNLSDENVLTSLLTYAFKASVQDVFLSDGLRWLHFNDFRPGKIEPSRVIQLSEGDIVESAAYFVQHIDAAMYWPEEEDIDSISQQVEQLRSNLQDVQRELVELKQGKEFPSRSIPTRDKVLVEKTPSRPLELHSIDDLPNLSGKSPNRMQLPNGLVVETRRWKDVLLAACRFVMENNPKIPVPLLDRAGKKVYLINIARPPKGISFYETKYAGKVVYIYTNYDSNNCVANAAHILKYTPTELRKVNAGVSFE